MSRSMLSVRNLEKHFVSSDGEVVALHGISFDVGEGEFFTLLGPSGCGKSTTLRCLAGLETVDSGEISIAGSVVASITASVPPNERDIGMVFQSYAIWPHMTVLENVLFPLSYRNGSGGRQLTRDEKRERGMEVLRLVQLEKFFDRPAPHLSGGQQQRIALARALVSRPKVLLLDEPLSNLDAKLREEMRVEIKELTTFLGITTVYVTHDQSEALAMSDRIAVMTAGQILQLGSPREVYLDPRTGDVARIVGTVNLLPGTIVGRDGGYGDVRVASGAVVRCRLAEGAGDLVSVLVRPEFVAIHPLEEQPHANGHNVINGTIRRTTFVGDHLDCYCDTADGVVRAKVPPDQDLRAGQQVAIVFSPRRSLAS